MNGLFTPDVQNFLLISMTKFSWYLIEIYFLNKKMFFYFSDWEKMWLSVGLFRAGTRDCAPWESISQYNFIRSGTRDCAPWESISQYNFIRSGTRDCAPWESISQYNSIKSMHYIHHKSSWFLGVFFLGNS